MRENILNLLKKTKRALDTSEIYSMLNLKTAEEFKELVKVTNGLDNDLEIYKTYKGKYMLFNDTNLKKGVMIATKKSFGFVDIEGDIDVFIPPRKINGAIHGDKVIVEITNRRGTELEGRIVKVTERTISNLVGLVVEEDNNYVLLLDEKKMKLKIILNKNNLDGAIPGHKVYVKVTKKVGNNVYLADVIKVLGHINEPGVDILSIVYNYNISDTFSDEIMDYLNDIPGLVSEEEIASRIRTGRDLRDEMIFTIDGDDTKDIDDAVSVEKLENGNFKLGVHIADVSYYVRKNDILDKEAFSRGTSVYLADRVIPMLPRKLSNGICSLNPGVDRLAMSCQMEIDSKGEIVDYEIFESIIRSRKKMTYKCVNSIIEKGVTPEGYEDFADKLILMEKLAKILRANKVKRGYIDFDIDESKIIVNDAGEAIDIVLRSRGMGEKLIEDFMIAANETVAKAVFFMELPFLYRVHGNPREEKIESFKSFVSGLGYKITGDFKKITPKTMQDILNQLKDKKEYHILSSLLLRSMQKAIYDKNNIGHFGLASTCYTHFTSPIRRYPDTIVHRLLRMYLIDNKMDKSTIKNNDLELITIGEHSSERERASVQCEREVDDMKKAEYMMKHIGEEFTGMISGITSFGMFIELPNLVEGLIKIGDLKDDRYVYDESTISLIGSRTKKRYRLGDNVDVVVSAASKETKTIDFVLKGSLVDKSKTNSRNKF